MSRIRRLKTKQLILTALFSCVFYFAAFVSPTRQSAQEFIAARVAAEIQTRMPEWFKQKETPGVAVAVVDDKAILWKEVYGTTSRGQDKPVTPRTLFSIQSMAKIKDKSLVFSCARRECLFSAILPFNHHQEV